MEHVRRVWSVWLPLSLGLLYAAMSLAAPATAQPVCVGDCNGSGDVTVDELIIMVNIALGNAQSSACPNGVPTGATVDITLIIEAVSNSLNGCAAIPTPTSALAVVGDWVGSLPDSSIFFALSSDGHNLIAYGCDGTTEHPLTFAQWFNGALSGDGANLTAPNGAHLTASLSTSAASGTLTLSSGETIDFVAPAIAGQDEAGLHRSEQTIDGVSYLAGWIVVPGSAPFSGGPPPSPNIAGAIINQATGALINPTTPNLVSQTAVVPTIGTFALTTCQLGVCLHRVSTPTETATRSATLTATRTRMPTATRTPTPAPAGPNDCCNCDIGTVIFRCGVPANGLCPSGCSVVSNASCSGGLFCLPHSTPTPPPTPLPTSTPARAGAIDCCFTFTSGILCSAPANGFCPSGYFVETDASCAGGILCVGHTPTPTPTLAPAGPNDCCECFSGLSAFCAVPTDGLCPAGCPKVKANAACLPSQPFFVCQPLASITDVSPTKENYTTPLNTAYQSVAGRMISLATSPDGQRVYAGAFGSGVWRSDDKGQTWRQLTQTQPLPGNFVTGTLGGTFIYNIVVPVTVPGPTGGDVVLAVADWDNSRIPSQNGIHKSIDSGVMWSLALPCDVPIGQIAVAPDDPSVIYAPCGSHVYRSPDLGETWPELMPPGGPVSAIAVGSLEAPGVRRLYALGSRQLWYSANDGQSWTLDAGMTIPGAEGGAASLSSRTSAQVLALEPGHPDHLYLAVSGGANGLVYFDPAFSPDGMFFCNHGESFKDTRPCGEGGLWLGDYSQFNQNKKALWAHQSGPPWYSSDRNTNSGGVGVLTQPNPDGSYLLFLADSDTVSVAQVSGGRPLTFSSWHRLDGQDPSQSQSQGNTPFIHPDPHAVAISPDFHIALKPAAALSPYNQNTVLDTAKPRSGSIYIANDGGAFYSSDGAVTWQLGDRIGGLAVYNLAGVAIAGHAPALYFGVSDNDNFYTLDGGATWRGGESLDGDADTWFADPLQPSRVVHVERNSNLVFYGSTSGLPDAGANPTVVPVPTLAPMSKAYGGCGALNPCVGFEYQGNRPVILTLATESPLADGDYEFIRFNDDGTGSLLRTQQLSKITAVADWVPSPTGIVTSVGPPFPAKFTVVQASGGHTATVFLAGDPGGTQSLYMWKAGLAKWKLLVPAANAPVQTGMPPGAERFFVNPYKPGLLYVMDSIGTIWRGADTGGTYTGSYTWQVDEALNTAVTESGTLVPVTTFNGGMLDTVLWDMVFDANDVNRAFAIGDGGVFFSPDGQRWVRFLSALALPGHPIAAYLDSVSDPSNPALYVGLDNQGVVRLDHWAVPQ